jgi:hypothetical protein
MKSASGTIATAVLLSLGACHATAANVSQALASDFLSRLMLARASSSEIAVIHQEVGSVMLISSEDGRKGVSYLRGNRNFTWAQIEDQISAASAQDKPIHVELARWTLDAQSCDEIDGKLANFLAKVKESLTDLGSRTDSKEILQDAATLRIQMAVTDGWLTIIPNGASNPPLQQAALQLHSVVSGCTNSLQPAVEQHDF